MLHSLDVLIVFVSLASDEYHVAFLCQHTSSLDSLTTVHDAHHLLHLLGCESRQHVVDDILGLLETRVVARDYDLVTLLHRLLSHQWTFALVAVATSTTYGDDLARLLLKHLMYGFEYILQSIRGMSVIYYGSKSIR